MKMPSLDIDELQNISPNVVLSYLESNRWVQILEKSTPEYSVWKYAIQNGKEAFVLLPVVKDIPDFASRIYDLIKVVAIVEQRSPSNIFDSLKAAKEFAETKDRDILNIRLKFSDSRKREIPSSNLGSLLTSFQNLVSSIALQISGRANDSRRIPEHILQQSQISVVGMFEGSFGLRLASLPLNSEQLEFFEKPLIRKTLQELFDLVRVSGDEQSLKEILIKLRKRSVSNYKQFLIALSQLETDNSIEWGSPDKDLGDSFELSKSMVQSALLTVAKNVDQIPEEIDILAEWIGGNKRSKKFEVKDIKTQYTYAGTVASTALKDIENTRISHLYDVRILNEPKLNEATQEIIPSYTLLKVEEPTT